MAHGRLQAMFGLGRGENSVTDPVDNSADAIVPLVEDDTAALAAATAALAAKVVASALTADGPDVNASTVLVDSGLSIALGVGTYVVEFNPVITTAGAADLKVAFAFSGTATGKVQDMGTGFTIVDLTTPISITGAGRTDFASYESQLTAMVVVTVAGTLKLQYAQNTSDVSNTHLDLGSVLRAVKV